METQYKSKLKTIILDLRHILEGYYDNDGIRHPGDMEQRLAALGVRHDRESLPPEQLPHLSDEDRRARLTVDAFIQSSLQSGRSREEAIGEFLQESAYTWANRLIALRCMEARGLIDEIIIQKDSYGGRSLKHHRLTRQNPEVCGGEDDGLCAALFAEFVERAGELPLLFRPDEPVIALKPGVAALKKCIRLLSADDEIFTAPDAPGWAYQYWNTEEKDRVFEKVRTVKGAKIEKGDIIPVTQLYTEPYMVKFLVQNSLGALWMAMHPASRLCESWEYYVRDADRPPMESKPLKRISFLDPCVGSGHFVLGAFDLLFDMYEEEGELTTPAEICDAILSHNLFGIDIDERAVQIAACALYMKAREKDRAFRPTRMNLTATNIHPGGDTDHMTRFLDRHPENKPFRNTLRLIFESLRHADELGSLTDAMTHPDHHCAVIGPPPPEEKTMTDDPTPAVMARLVCADAESMMKDALKRSCAVWWKTFETIVLKPVSEKIRDARKEQQSLKERALDPKVSFKEQSELKRIMNALKADLKARQQELTMKTEQGQAVRNVIESWQCPEALTWESWLAGQAMYDQLSGLNGKRQPPQTVAEFIRQESLYQPDINDGVRVNIAPLQKAGLLTTDVLAGRDVDKAISDRAAWRDDERRWCREGKLPKPGWWESTMIHVQGWPKNSTFRREEIHNDNGR